MNAQQVQEIATYVMNNRKKEIGDDLAGVTREVESFLGKLKEAGKLATGDNAYVIESYSYTEDYSSNYAHILIQKAYLFSDKEQAQGFVNEQEYLDGMSMEGHSSYRVATISELADEYFFSGADEFSIKKFKDYRDSDFSDFI